MAAAADALGSSGARCAAASTATTASTALVVAPAWWLWPGLSLCLVLDMDMSENLAADAVKASCRSGTAATSTHAATAILRACFPGRGGGFAAAAELRYSKRGCPSACGRHWSDRSGWSKCTSRSCSPHAEAHSRNLQGNVRLATHHGAAAEAVSGHHGRLPAKAGRGPAKATRHDHPAYRALCRIVPRAQDSGLAAR